MPLTIWNAYKGQLISNPFFFQIKKTKIEPNLSMAAIRTILSSRNVQGIEKMN
jgi:hypothetical protein